METDKNKDQNQGKQSTAKTDATYNRDADSLKNSATTSQNSGTSPGKIGAGGVITNEDKSGALKSMKGEDRGKLDAQNPTPEGKAGNKVDDSGGKKDQ